MSHLIHLLLGLGLGTRLEDLALTIPKLECHLLQTTSLSGSKCPRLSTNKTQLFVLKSGIWRDLSGQGSIIKGCHGHENIPIAGAGDEGFEGVMIRAQLDCGRKRHSNRWLISILAYLLQRGGRGDRREGRYYRPLIDLNFRMFAFCLFFGRGRHFGSQR